MSLLSEPVARSWRENSRRIVQIPIVLKNTLTSPANTLDSVYTQLNETYKHNAIVLFAPRLNDAVVINNLRYVNAVFEQSNGSSFEMCVYHNPGAIFFAPFNYFSKQVRTTGTAATQNARVLSSIGYTPIENVGTPHTTDTAIEWRDYPLSFPFILRSPYQTGASQTLIACALNINAHLRGITFKIGSITDASANPAYVMAVVIQSEFPIEY